jgi:hypothetical protein
MSRFVKNFLVHCDTHGFVIAQTLIQGLPMVAALAIAILIPSASTGNVHHLTPIQRLFGEHQPQLIALHPNSTIVFSQRLCFSCNFQRRSSRPRNFIYYTPHLFSFKSRFIVSIVVAINRTTISFIPGSISCFDHCCCCVCR